MNPEHLVTIDTLVEDEQWYTLQTASEYELLFHQIANVAAQQCGWKRNITVSVTLTNDDHIKQLNNDYRGQDKATNVLSFSAVDDIDMLPQDCHIPLGDVILSWETLEREATTATIPLINHVTHLFLHGTLHLMGFDHENDHDQHIMESLETAILTTHFNIPNPYAL